MIATSPMLEVNAGFSTLDYSVGFALIARAITNGHDEQLLRWRMSPDQANAALDLGMMIGNDPPALEFVRTQAAFTRGNYCGLPLTVDHAMPPGTVVLEKLEPSTIGRIFDMAIPRGFCP